MLRRRIFNVAVQWNLRSFHQSSAALCHIPSSRSEQVPRNDTDIILKKIHIMNKRRRVYREEVAELVSAHMLSLRTDKDLLGRLLWTLGRKAFPLDPTLLDAVNEVLFVRAGDSGWTLTDRQSANFLLGLRGGVWSTDTATASTRGGASVGAMTGAISSVLCRLPPVVSPRTLTHLLQSLSGLMKTPLVLQGEMGVPAVVDDALTLFLDSVGSRGGQDGEGGEKWSRAEVAAALEGLQPLASSRSDQVGKILVHLGSCLDLQNEVEPITARHVAQLLSALGGVKTSPSHSMAKDPFYRQLRDALLDVPPATITPSDLAAMVSGLRSVLVEIPATTDATLSSPPVYWLSAEKRSLVAALTTVLKHPDQASTILEGSLGVRAVWGCSGLSTSCTRDRDVVLALVAALADKIRPVCAEGPSGSAGQSSSSSRPQRVSPTEAARALQAFADLSSDFPQVRRLVSALSSLLLEGGGDRGRAPWGFYVRGVSVGIAVSGLRSMSSEWPEVRALMSALAASIRAGHSQLYREETKGATNDLWMWRALSGMGMMSSDHVEVCDLLEALVAEAQREKLQLSAGTALQGLASMSHMSNMDTHTERRCVRAVNAMLDFCNDGLANHLSLAGARELLCPQIVSRAIAGLRRMDFNQEATQRVLCLLSRCLSRDTFALPFAASVDVMSDVLAGIEYMPLTCTSSNTAVEEARDSLLRGVQLLCEITCQENKGTEMTSVEWSLLVHRLRFLPGASALVTSLREDLFSGLPQRSHDNDDGNNNTFRRRGFMVRPDWSGRSIARAVNSFQSLSSLDPKTCRMLTALHDSISPSAGSVSVSTSELTFALSGLRHCTSDQSSVRAVLRLLAALSEGTPETGKIQTMGADELGQALLGLRLMNSHVPAVQMVLGTLCRRAQIHTVKPSAGENETMEMSLFVESLCALKDMCSDHTATRAAMQCLLDRLPPSFRDSVGAPACTVLEPPLPSDKAGADVVSYPHVQNSLWKAHRHVGISRSALFLQPHLDRGMTGELASYSCLGLRGSSGKWQESAALLRVVCRVADQAVGFTANDIARTFAGLEGFGLQAAETRMLARQLGKLLPRVVGGESVGWRHAGVVLGGMQRMGSWPDDAHALLQALADALESSRKKKVGRARGVVGSAGNHSRWKEDMHAADRGLLGLASLSQTMALRGHSSVSAFPSADHSMALPPGSSGDGMFSPLGALRGSQQGTVSLPERLSLEHHLHQQMQNQHQPQSGGMDSSGNVAVLDQMRSLGAVFHLVRGLAQFALDVTQREVARITDVATISTDNSTFSSGDNSDISCGGVPADSSLMGVCSPDRSVSEMASDLEQSLALLSHFAPPLPEDCSLLLQAGRRNARLIAQAHRQSDPSATLSSAVLDDVVGVDDRQQTREIVRALQALCRDYSTGDGSLLYEVHSNVTVSDEGTFSADVLVFVPSEDVTTTAEVLLESLSYYYNEAHGQALAGPDGVLGAPGDEWLPAASLGTGGAVTADAPHQTSRRAINIQFEMTQRRAFPCERRRAQLRDRLMEDTLPALQMCSRLEVKRVMLDDVYNSMLITKDK